MWHLYNLIQEVRQFLGVSYCCLTQYTASSGRSCPRRRLSAHPECINYRIGRLQTDPPAPHSCCYPSNLVPFCCSWRRFRSRQWCVRGCTRSIRDSGGLWAGCRTKPIREAGFVPYARYRSEQERAHREGCGGMGQRCPGAGGGELRARKRC